MKSIIYEPKDEKEFRKIAEQKKEAIILVNNVINKRDKLKQLSGINDVIAKILVKSKGKLGIDLDKIISLSDREKAKQLSRIRELIKICRRNKTEIILKNTAKEARDILISLGASTEQAKQATSQYF